MSSARDQQIQALFQAALQRPPAERAAFLTALTGDDAALRQSVERLLSTEGATEVGMRTGADESAPELEIGASVRQYRIDGVLGRGGMGVVYRATDTKLHRSVAIKFLSSLVGDADARRRFKREAETTSSLNHPHIVTVYDVGEHNGREYIVSELVDGGALDDWLTKTRKPSWRQSVELLTGVADALASAHAAGVLHRDVKPGNILIGSNGYAKLADFGLAKLLDSTSSDASHRATQTRMGVVVGTVAYMSPEQAAGLAVDARSDVFSFGVVLYELIAGRRPFEGSTDLEVLKSIAHATPAPLHDDIPELLRMTIDKALEKEPSDRYQTMLDFVADLKRVARKGSQTGVVAARPRKRTRLPWIVTSAVLAVALAAVLTLLAPVLFKPGPPVHRIHFTIPAPAAWGSLSISPDGSTIAYITPNADGVCQIWIRGMDSSEAHALPGTEQAAGAFWSRDSRSLAFVSDDTLRTIDLGADTSRPLAEGPDLLGLGGWSKSGTILFSRRTNRGNVAYEIARVPVSGGTTSAVTNEASAPRPEPGHVLPSFLPDDKHFLYATTAGPGIGTVRVGSLDSPKSIALTTAVVDAGPLYRKPQYADGFLLYMTGLKLVAQRFDLDALALRGESQTIAENVEMFSVASDASPSVLVYSQAIAPHPTTRRLVWMDRSGQRIGEVPTPPMFRFPSLSPDGKRVSMQVPVSGGTQALIGDIWIVDTQRGVFARLTDDDAETPAVWSPDGTQIVFASKRGGSARPNAIYERAANNAGVDTLLFQGRPDEILFPIHWLKDAGVAFHRIDARAYDLWLLPMMDDRTTRPLVESKSLLLIARLSPDGKWIAFCTNSSNSFQIAVQPVNGVRDQTLVGSGFDPHWRADGEELYFINQDGDVMVVDVEHDSSFRARAPRKLFSTGNKSTGVPEYWYDVTPDGERFLVIESSPTEPAASSATPPPKPIHVIVNWTAGLATK